MLEIIIKYWMDINLSFKVYIIAKIGDVTTAFLLLNENIKTFIDS